MAETIIDVTRRKITTWLLGIVSSERMGTTIQDVEREFYYQKNNLTGEMSKYSNADHERDYYLKQLGNPNLVSNPSFEVDTNGWAAIGAGTLLTRDTLQFQSGIASGKIVTPGTISGEGARNSPGPSAIPMTSYTVTLWLKGEIGGEIVRISLWSSPTATSFSNQNVTLTTVWQQFTITGVSLGTTSSIYLALLTTTPVAQTFYVDTENLIPTIAPATKLSMADLENAFYDLNTIPAGSLSDREYAYWSGVVLV
jgi:hypothetical protein